MSMLSTRDLSRHFGGLKAVENVDFDLPAGQVRALIGPNGAGKTTFVGMLSGRIPASRGQIVFDGSDVTSEPAHRRIRAGMAYTFQITSVYGRLPVTENVALAVRWRTGGDEAETGRRVREALERVGIADRADQLAGDLSYGHQRLLEIAMGLSQGPRLLILDEATEGLAPIIREQIWACLAMLKNAGQSILVIDKNINALAKLANHHCILEKGRVVWQGDSAELMANPDLKSRYLGV